jgi:hypothetical protein
MTLGSPSPNPRPSRARDANAVAGVSRTRVGRPARSTASIAVAFGVFLVADLISSQLVIAAAFGSPNALIAVAAVALGASGVLVVAVSGITGSLRVAGPLVATFITALLGGWALVNKAVTPIYTEPATPGAHVLICVAGALILGLFLGPLGFRIVGGLAAAGVVAYAAWIAPPLSTDTRPPASGDRRQIEANFEEFLDTGTRPLVPDDPAWPVAYLDASGGPATSVIMSPKGRATTIVADNTPLSLKWDAGAYVCWQLTDRYSTPDTETTFADWGDRCAVTEDGWMALDRTAFAWTTDGMVTLAVATRSTDFTDVPDARPATFEEMSTLREKLRPMTKDEMRAEFADDFLGPEQWR